MSWARIALETSTRPSSSSAIAASTSPMPMPPYRSPTVMPNRSALRSASHDASGNSSVSSQWRALGASSRSATSRASFRSACWSSFSANGSGPASLVDIPDRVVRVLVASRERARWRRPSGQGRAPQRVDLGLGKPRAQVASPRLQVVEQQPAVRAHLRLLGKGAGVLRFDAGAVVVVAGAVDHEPREAHRRERVERFGRGQPHERALPVAVAATYRAPAPSERVRVQPAAHLVVRTRPDDHPGFGEEYVRHL